MSDTLHRKRFELCMKHRESDKVPSDLWIDSSDGELKEQLIRYAGAQSYEELLDILDVDIYHFKPPVARKEAYTDGTLSQFFLPVIDEKYLSFSADGISRPLVDVEEPEELNQFQWPKSDLLDYSAIESIINTHGDRVLWAQAGTWSPIFCKLCDLCGMEKVLVDMIVNPELIDAMVSRVLDFYRETFRKTLEAGRGRIDVFGFGDDIASQQGLMFSKELWKRYFMQPMKELCELIKSYGAYVAFHSCGAISDIIPELIEMGVDILFPIQPRAKGMEPERLKEAFGNRVVFYGGIDVQQVLPFGTEQEVRDEVAQVSGILGAGGGYILASSHGILRDVPMENVMAMYSELNRLAGERK